MFFKKIFLLITVIYLAVSNYEFARIHPASFGRIFQDFFTKGSFIIHIYTTRWVGGPKSEEILNTFDIKL